jgi:hypothetical protein
MSYEEYRYARMEPLPSKVRAKMDRGPISAVDIVNLIIILNTSRDVLDVISRS